MGMLQIILAFPNRERPCKVAASLPTGLALIMPHSCVLRKPLPAPESACGSRDARLALRNHSPSPAWPASTGPSARGARILLAKIRQIRTIPELRFDMATGAAEEMRVAPESDDILTIDGLAEYLKISKSTLYKLAKEGKLPGQKVGKRWRFHREAVDRWLQNDLARGDPRAPNT